GGSGGVADAAGNLAHARGQLPVEAAGHGQRQHRDRKAGEAGAEGREHGGGGRPPPQRPEAGPRAPPGGGGGAGAGGGGGAGGGRSSRRRRRVRKRAPPHQSGIAR